MQINQNNWHQLSSDEVAKLLEADPESGLSAAQVADRLARFGRNALEEKRARSPWRMLLDQFTDFMIVG
jgi:Ca2+-transporting ATPase